MVLSLEAPEACGVAVAGTFNGWNTEKHALKRNKKGTWTKALSLRPGSYEYKFLVDGEWLEAANGGEAAINSFGTLNSVLTV